MPIRAHTTHHPVVDARWSALWTELAQDAHQIVGLDACSDSLPVYIRGGVLALDPAHHRRMMRPLLAVLCAACSSGHQNSDDQPDPDAPGTTDDANGSDGMNPVDVVIVGAGDIAGGGSGPVATAELIKNIPGAVFTLGDNAYSNGSSDEFTTRFEPTWGQFKSRIKMPTPGNHDYNTSNAAGYFGYFGAAAGDPSKGYY